MDSKVPSAGHLPDIFLAASNADALRFVPTANRPHCDSSPLRFVADDIPLNVPVTDQRGTTAA